jgi:hypothetical protein
MRLIVARERHENIIAAEHTTNLPAPWQFPFDVCRVGYVLLPDELYRPRPGDDVPK